jgi:hypothetical protein
MTEVLHGASPAKPAAMSRPFYAWPMDPVEEPLSLYGSPSDATRLDWHWVQQELDASGTYWISAHGDRRPVERPVWGVWRDGALHLSIGSPTIRRAIAVWPCVTVHLDSSTDVVMLEGEAIGTTVDQTIVAEYDRKYDWNYAIDEYGPLTTIAVDVVMAWRSAGWAGRDGFTATGRWRFPRPEIALAAQLDGADDVRRARIWRDLVARVGASAASEQWLAHFAATDAPITG